MPQIKEILIEANKWWKEPLQTEYKEREIYEKIKKYVPLKQIIAFTGLRRVGKTTLMLKIVEDAIKEGINPYNIVYFSCDEYHDIELRTVLKEYEGLKNKLLGNEKYIFLFDEIQKVKSWEEQIKRIYDLHSKNIKIIVSGSESLFIRRKSKESLAGRIFEFKIESLTFKEFLYFKEIKIDNDKLHEKELEMLFNEFIITQGFPEMIGIQDKEVINKYLRENIIDKTIYNDIPLLFSIKDITLVKSIVNIIMENPGQIIELNDLAKELSIARQTISLYLSYLEDSFLIRKLYNYSRNRRKIERKLKKYYPAILDSSLLFREDEYSQSKVFETIIINQLNAEFFWRDPYKNEVDAVINVNKPLPIEIKYGKVETHGLLKFMEEFKSKEGYIISRNKQDKIQHEGKTIVIIPAFLFFRRKIEDLSYEVNK
ncbi:ATP-binding protein [Candidatus Woesearchaeota archaeon]|nr:ATP-binding protein [Candidatus Woesearchaeota archaeon]